MRLVRQFVDQLFGLRQYVVGDLLRLGGIECLHLELKDAGGMVEIDRDHVPPVIGLVLDRLAGGKAEIVVPPAWRINSVEVELRIDVLQHSLAQQVVDQGVGIGNGQRFATAWSSPWKISHTSASFQAKDCRPSSRPISC